MKKFLQYSARAVAIFIGLIILMYALAYIYVASNRQKIIDKVTSEIAAKLQGTIGLGDVDVSFFTNFPKVSVVFKDVSIRDSLYSQHKHSFFEAKKLYGHVSLVNLIQGKDPLNGLRIDDGSLYLYTDTSGYTNSYLFTPKKKEVDTTATTKNSDGFKSLRFKKFRFVLDNQKKEKLIDVEVYYADVDIRSKDELLSLHIEKNSIIHSLAFNLSRGSYARETSFESEFDLTFDKNLRKLYFKEMKVLLKGHPFVFDGEFNFAGDKTYKLNIATKQVKDTFVHSLLTPKIAKGISIVKVEKPVDAQAHLIGVLAPGEPLVVVEWQVKNNNIQSAFFDVTNATFTGGYTNEVDKNARRNDENSTLHVDNFTGNWEGLQVSSKRAVINDLVHPIIDCDLQSKFQLSTLNNLLESKSFILKKGNGLLDIKFHGPMMENSNRNTSIDGKLSFDNGNILYAPRQMSMENASGAIQFKHSDVFVSDLKFNVKDNYLTMNGTGKNLLSLIKSNPGKISLDWQIFSPALNLESLTPLLKKRNKVVVSTASRGKLKKIAGQIDELLNTSNLKLQVKANKLLFKRFEATDVNANIDMEAEDWNLKDVSLKHANGMMRLNGKLKEQDARSYAAAINVTMNNVDINKVLYSFNNFSQDAIKSENIRGKLSSNVVMSMNIDRQMQREPTNLEGFLDFSLKNGALINFEPMQKLQFFLFKNRNFDEIRFAELKNRIELKNRSFIINRMEIQSSALTLFVKGIYSLDGNTDLSMQVPLSNLKKRGEDYKPENIGADAKAGPSVYIRGKPGEDGSIKFKLDILNKIRKRVKGDDE